MNAYYTNYLAAIAGAERGTMMTSISILAAMVAAILRTMVICTVIYPAILAGISKQHAHIHTNYK
jgi:hypothetical protein